MAPTVLGRGSSVSSKRARQYRTQLSGCTTTNLLAPVDKNVAMFRRAPYAMSVSSSQGVRIRAKF
eukprot:2716374-Pyramimonas_sp.AAC.2